MFAESYEDSTQLFFIMRSLQFNYYFSGMLELFLDTSYLICFSSNLKAESVSEKWEIVPRLIEETT